MEAIVYPSNLSGTIKAIASKSCAHRLLICSALSDKQTFISCEESSEDIDATARCLNALGARIERAADGFMVNPLNLDNITKNAVLDCGESGSTLRFMLPVACALGADSTFLMGGRLPERPMTDLIDALTSHGCTLCADGAELKTSGRLYGGSFTIPGNVSSQYVSGLLFALPLVQGGGVIELTGEIESKNYILMTLEALDAFGVKAERGEKSFTVKAGAKYVSPENVGVEGDWSNAAFWLCAAAMGRIELKCTGLNANSIQGDSEIAEIISRFGAKVEKNGDTVTVTPRELHGIEVDAKNIPDLVPAIAAVASVAKGRTVIKNAARLRIKESDRLYTVSKTLSELGADIEETADGLIINGREELKGGTVDACGDHRIAMMAAIAAARCQKAVHILNAEAVRKSYPAFFEDYMSLGGKVRKGD